MLAVAAVNNWKGRQFDIITAYLNSDLEEETYMEQPAGYDIGKGLVCKVLKAIYGLKQAPRAWYKTLKSYGEIWIP